MVAVRAKAPSNIAFIKYWGKRDPGRRWPVNDSLSMTLSASVTETIVSAAAQDQVILSGVSQPDGCPFAARVLEHVDRLRSELRVGGAVRIETANSFPMSSGIASSASGFAALTLAFVGHALSLVSFSDLDLAGFSRDRLAALARLGSGSACRSFWGGYVGWSAGASPEEQVVQQLFAPDHWDLADLILISDDGHKAQSSSDGHRVALESPLFPIRICRLAERQAMLHRALAERDFPTFGRLLEDEALELQAVLLTSSVPCRFVTPAVSAVFSWLSGERKLLGPIAFATMDAGSTVHLICESQSVPVLLPRLREKFPEMRVLQDRVGHGPTINAL